MAASLGELLYRAIQSRLEGIQGSLGYEVSIASVARAGTIAEVGDLISSPTIARPAAIVKFLEADRGRDADTYGMTTVVDSSAIVLLFDGAADSATVKAWEAALVRALYPEDGYGIGARVLGLSVAAIDTEIGVGSDGLIASLSIEYRHLNGDPSQGG